MASKLLLLYAPFIVVGSLLLRQAQPQQDENVYGGREYYIITEQLMCPPEFEACLTLDQFITSSSRYLFENTTLIFQRKQHILISQLMVVNVSQFSMIAEESNNNSYSATSIVCNENFVFENVREVYMRGLLFVHCTQNVVENVDNIFVENCTFDRQDHHGIIFHTLSSKAVFIDCRFVCTSLHMSYYDYDWQSSLVPDGAINSTRSAINIHGSIFEKTGEMEGVAIQIMQESELFLNDTTFVAVSTDSTYYYDRDYGAVHAYDGSTAVIVDSSFDLGRNGSFQCPLISFNSSLILHGCVLHNDTIRSHFIYSIDSNVTLSQTVIASNSMYGGIMATGGSVSINNCTIKDNRVAYFALINVNRAQVTMEDTDIINNVGDDLILLHSCQVSIFACTFERNGAYSVVWMTLSNGEISASYFIENKNASGGVIYSSIANVHIYSCKFDGNVVEGLGFGVTSIYGRSVDIDSCTFDGNIARAIGIVTGTVNIVNCNFTGNVANLKGGVVYLEFTHSVTIDNCTFSGNKADYGAAIFAVNGYTNISNTQMYDNIANIAGIIVVYDGELNTHEVSLFSNTASSAVIALTSCKATFTGNTTLKNNKGSFYILEGNVIVEDNMHITNCTPSVDNNVIPAEEGGAITVFQSLVTFRATVTLTDNVAENGGAMFISESHVFIIGPIEVSRNCATNAGGGVYLHQSRLNIQERCEISGNTAVNGGGVYAVSSTIILEDNQQQFFGYKITFTSNYADVSGGAMFLSTSSKINSLLILSTVHHIYFIENRAGEHGGALYINDQTNFEQCNSSDSITMSSADRECFYQILAVYPEQLSAILNEQNDAALNFTGNSAILTGDTIYGGLLDRCTLNRLNPYRSQGTSFQGLSFLTNISNIDYTDSITSYPVKLCFCDAHGVPDCKMNPSPILVKKGHRINISLVAVDQVEHVLESNVTASLLSNQGSLREGQQLQKTSEDCSNSRLVYNVMSPLRNETLILSAVGPCGNAYPSQLRVELVFEECTCPIGFQPITDKRSTTNCLCDCHSNLTNFVSIETCNSTSATFQRNSNSWISSTTVKGSLEPFLLIHAHCPYDYCRSDYDNIDINLIIPDGFNVQCDFNRNSTLCGRCLQNFSLSFGSSRCIECGDDWPGVLVGITFLTIGFGIVLVSVLLFLNLTVAIGTINGILFYANVINANKSTYFSGLTTSGFPSDVIAWLNLDIGFDICLLEGLDTYAKTWIQLLLPIYLIVLVVLVIVISQYSQKFATLIGKKNPVSTLATLILILYAKLLSTVITILSVTTLKYPDGDKLLWKPDATIAYLKSPRYAFLFFAGLMILVLGGAFTGLLLPWQILVRLSNWSRTSRVFGWIRNPKLSSFIETYHAPYTTRYRYWTGLLLLVRVIVYLATALNTSGNPQVPLLATTLSVGCLLILLLSGNGSRNLYKKTPVYALEVVSLSNLLIFTAITTYSDGANNPVLHSPAAYVSVVITSIQILLVLLYHLYAFTGVKTKIKGTELYAKITSLMLTIKEHHKETDHPSSDTHGIEADTRDINIFELVTSSDENQYRPPSIKQVNHQLQLLQPTVSVVEIACT